MPRQTAFDPQDKLFTAMKVFWQRGYEATSLQNLCDAMQINRFSVYNTFGDKLGLFNLALDLYRSTIFRRILLPLTSEQADIRSIREYFANLEAALCGPGGEWGCLLQATSMDPRLPESTRERVHAGFEQLVNLFRNALRRSKLAQELQPDLDIWQAAEFLMINVQGILSYRRGGGTPSQVQHYFRVLHQVLAQWSA